MSTLEQAWTAIAPVATPVINGVLLGLSAVGIVLLVIATGYQWSMARSIEPKRAGLANEQEAAKKILAYLLILLLAPLVIGLLVNTPAVWTAVKVAYSTVTLLCVLTVGYPNLILEKIL